MYLLDEIKVTVVKDAQTAGTSDVTSSIVDMSGYDGVLFLALTGDVTATSVLTLTAKSNTANSTSSPTPTTDGATTAFTAAASDADVKALAVDVHRPTSRYAFCVLSRGTANAVVNGIVAIQYRARGNPPTQSDIIAAARATLT